MKISVITTVKNEGQSIAALLNSLRDQTLAADEVIVSDGGSTDETLAIVEEYRRILPLHVVLAPGSNISTGRNRAIARASGDIIAVTDGGVVLSPTWLEELTRPIREDGATVVSGWFEPDPHTDFEVVMGATVLPDYSDIDPLTFLPSSRSVAFRKSAWKAVGGYPEWLDYSEDLVFDLALRERFGAFTFAPGAIAYFRPRGTWAAFSKQYYQYARGDGKADLWRKRHAIRYATYLLALPILLRGLWLGRWWAPLGLLAGVVGYCRRPAERLWPATYGWRLPARLRAFALIPLIRLVGDIAKMAGYPVGVRWRLRERPPGMDAVAVPPPGPPVTTREPRP